MSAKTKERPKRAPRPKKKFFPGMEPPHHPEIDRAAEEYVSCRDARIKMNQEESEAHDVLMKAMTDKGLDFYEFDDFVVRIDATKKAKVAKKKEPDNGDE